MGDIYKPINLRTLVGWGVLGYPPTEGSGCADKPNEKSIAVIILQ